MLHGHQVFLKNVDVCCKSIKPTVRLCTMTSFCKYYSTRAEAFTRIGLMWSMRVKAAVEQKARCNTTCHTEEAPLLLGCGCRPRGKPASHPRSFSFLKFRQAVCQQVAHLRRAQRTFLFTWRNRIFRSLSLFLSLKRP